MAKARGILGYMSKAKGILDLCMAKASGILWPWAKGMLRLVLEGPIFIHM